MTRGGTLPEIATSISSKDWKEVAYYLKASNASAQGSAGAAARGMPCLRQLLNSGCPVHLLQSEDAEQDAEEQRPRQDQELGMRKSSRTEHVDFKMKEDER